MKDERMFLDLTFQLARLGSMHRIHQCFKGADFNHKKTIRFSRRNSQFDERKLALQLRGPPLPFVPFMYPF
jgi:hypothetical protein